MFVICLRESSMGGTYLWLLKAAEYGFMNSGSKWQLYSDELIFNLGLTQCKPISQPFFPAIRN